MLRLLLAALVVANIAFFAYTRGAFDGHLGLRSQGDREPERLAHQVKPETIRLLPTAPAASAPAEPAACFETPVFAASESAAIEAVLAAALPAGTWADVRGERVTGTSTGPRGEATHLYRVVAADPALAARLLALKLDASGRGFSACARPDRTPR